jgi:hypothetical protein
MACSHCNREIEARPNALCASLIHWKAWAEVVEQSATRWPLREMLARLIESSDHLLRDHDCDAHGHEMVKGAADAARGLLRRLEER